MEGFVNLSIFLGWAHWHMFEHLATNFTIQSLFGMISSKKRDWPKSFSNPDTEDGEWVFDYI
jgi:hypothetical protein